MPYWEGDSRNQYRVYTRDWQNHTYRVPSATPLHPKVRAQLQAEASHRAYAIYDTLGPIIGGWEVPDMSDRKVFYVTYYETPLRGLCGDLYLVFDQLSGELLYGR